MIHLHSFQRPSKRTLTLVVATAVITIVITTLAAIWLAINMNRRIPSLGTIVTYGVEAYWDADLQNKTEAINWGTVLLWAPQNVTLYLKSISNIETTLNQATENWTFWNAADEIVAGPSNSTPYMYLTWDYDNSTVQPGEIIQVTLTLHASSSSEFIEFLIAKEVKAFSFDIHISTSQHS